MTTVHVTDGGQVTAIRIGEYGPQLYLHSPDMDRDARLKMVDLLLTVAHEPEWNVAVSKGWEDAAVTRFGSKPMPTIEDMTDRVTGRPATVYTPPEDLIATRASGDPS